MTRVVIAGARGRLGRLAAAAVDAAPDLRLAGTLVRGDDPERALDPAAHDVLLDVTVADASRALAPLAARRGLAVVVGTSGLLADDLDELRRAASDGGVGVLVVPNFSVGAVLQMQAAEALARVLGDGSILEVHHPAKRDAPSGTARATAERMHRAARERDPAAAPPPIESRRTEGVVARQVVTVDTGDERVVLEHEVRDRAAFLPGLLLALRAAPGLRGLHVGLDALLARPDGGLL